MWEETGEISWDLKAQNKGFRGPFLGAQLHSSLSTWKSSALKTDIYQQAVRLWN